MAHVICAPCLSISCNTGLQLIYYVSIVLETTVLGMDVGFTQDMLQ